MRKKQETMEWLPAHQVLESPPVGSRRRSMGKLKAKKPSPKNNRRQSIMLKRLDAEEVSTSPMRTRRKSMGPATMKSMKMETKIPMSTSTGSIKKKIPQKDLKSKLSESALENNVSTSLQKATTPKAKKIANKSANGLDTSTTTKNGGTPKAKSAANKSANGLDTSTSAPKGNQVKQRRNRIIRRPSLLELETIDMNDHVTSQKRRAESPEVEPKTKKAKSSSALIEKETITSKKPPVRSKSQVNTLQKAKNGRKSISKLPKSTTKTDLEVTPERKIVYSPKTRSAKNRHQRND